MPGAILQPPATPGLYLYRYRVEVLLYPTSGPGMSTTPSNTGAWGAVRLSLSFAHRCALSEGEAVFILQFLFGAAYVHALEGLLYGRWRYYSYTHWPSTRPEPTMAINQMYQRARAVPVRVPLTEAQLRSVAAEASNQLERAYGLRPTRSTRIDPWPGLDHVWLANDLPNW